MQISEMTQFLIKTVSRKTAATVFSQTRPLEAEFQLSPKMTILDLDEMRNFREGQNFEIRLEDIVKRRFQKLHSF